MLDTWSTAIVGRHFVNVYFREHALHFLPAYQRLGGDNRRSTFVKIAGRSTHETGRQTHPLFDQQTNALSKKICRADCFTQKPSLLIASKSLDKTSALRPRTDIRKNVTSRLILCG
jgi:hypothetical protein